MDKISQSSLANVRTEDRVTILLAAYDKHSKEQLALEESQEKLVIILLGIFSAGITALQWLRSLLPPVKGALVVLAILLTAVGAIYTCKRNKARAGIRELIVRIEMALDFYREGVYLTNESLYKEKHLLYAKWRWLGLIYWLVILSALAFIVLVLKLK